MPGLLIGYARVSTDEQDLTAQRDGLQALGVPAERIRLSAAICEGGHLPRQGTVRFRVAVAAVKAKRAEKGVSGSSRARQGRRSHPKHLCRLAPALLTALLALAPSVAAAAPASGEPETQARVAALDGGAVEPGVPINFVGVQWRGARDGGSIRVRRDGRWEPWRELHAGELHARGRNASELVAAADASAYQVRLADGARDGRATAISTTAAPRRSARSGFRPGYRRRWHGCFRSRADWGADESLRFRSRGVEIWPPAYFPVQKLTVHHIATDAGGADPAAVVRAIYRYHAVDLGYGDIGYHLLVDERGCVYEGRHSGADRLPVYGSAAPDGTPRAVNAGHVFGFNAGNVGVALLGDFSEREPTRRARRAAERALAALAHVSGLDPLGGGLYVNPITGATKDLPTISGHRDWLATECPGALLYPQLPAIRQRVARLVSRSRAG